ncbi:MAG: response regulator with CheY-like receiver domain and winged-helix DNA-binding domain [Acidimicrobiales bacterium]|nr:response regulator with CheY-like receiver domain and winged-helix DNA-binding domain [Acidimicrobiales bacterium]
MFDAVHVLIVEDDIAIAAPLEKGLRREGFVVSLVGTGAEALAARGHDLVLLDLGLPDMDGFEVCRQLRNTSAVPIIVVTARGEEVDRVIGLELGADDYLVKPFGFRELVARIRAVTRRAGATTAAGGEGAVTTVADLLVDRRARRVAVAGEEIELTRKEFDLLAFLAEDPGATRTRRQILESVWDAHWYGPTKTIDVHVASLRRKLDRPDLIDTVRGVGYRLCTDR